MFFASSEPYLWRSQATWRSSPLRLEGGEFYPAIFAPILAAVPTPPPYAHHVEPLACIEVRPGTTENGPAIRLKHGQQDEPFFVADEGQVNAGVQRET